MANCSDTIVYLGEQLGRYGFGEGHPFGPDRQAAFSAEAARRGLLDRARVLEPVTADRALLERFHTRAYLDYVARRCAHGSGFLDDGNTPALAHLPQAAACVVGSTVDACRRLLRGDAARAFVPIAGLHHARRDAAEGFCVYNDIGVAIETARIESGTRRIAYVDMDAHHGDGVYDSYAWDPDVYIADLHEDGAWLYPGSGHAWQTGEGPALGTKLNIPLPPNAGDGRFHESWPAVEALVERAAPQLIMFQCGVDSLAGDPLAHLRLSPEAHAHATCSLLRLARRHAGGRLLVMGGGGYSLGGIAAGWCRVLHCLLED